jgi:CRP-like cAMP-binding protein
VVVALETLATTSFFETLSVSTLERLAEVAQEIECKTGQVLYAQDDPPAGLFVLQSGRIKLYRQSKERMQILAILMPGECFGAESLPIFVPNPCTAATLTPITAIQILTHDLQGILDDCPDMQIAFLEVVSLRLKQFVNLVHNLAFRDVTSRLAGVLLIRAKAEGEMTEDGIRIARLLSQQELAAMVGTAREVIYRVFKKLERNNILQVTSKHILILDFDQLSSIAGQETR